MRYSDPSFLGGTQQTLSSSEEQLFIDGLHPGVEYSFTVTAFNDIGFGSDSEPLLVTTLDERTQKYSRHFITLYCAISLLVKKFITYLKIFFCLFLSFNCVGLVSL